MNIHVLCQPLPIHPPMGKHVDIMKKERSLLIVSFYEMCQKSTFLNERKSRVRLVKATHRDQTERDKRIIMPAGLWCTLELLPGAHWPSLPIDEVEINDRMACTCIKYAPFSFMYYLRRAFFLFGGSFFLFWETWIVFFLEKYDSNPFPVKQGVALLHPV